LSALAGELAGSEDRRRRGTGERGEHARAGSGKGSGRGSADGGTCAAEASGRALGASPARGARVLLHLHPRGFRALDQPVPAADRLVPARGYTLRWYENAFSRSEFRHGFGQSLQVACIATVIGVSAGVSAAYALVRFRFPGCEVFNSLLLGPLVVPGIVAGTSLCVYYIMVENLLDVGSRGTLHGLVLAISC
jgi:ABC-type glycerol-3-phosphate transport system permease component